VSTHDKDAAGFYRLARWDEVKAGQVLQVAVVDGNRQVEVGLVLLDGQLIAFRDVCPHMAFPLSIGRLQGKTLECAGHNWKFDLTTGKALHPPVRQTMVFYEYRVEAADIWVKIDPFF
jgi:nitrite reductase/ring-hydroxylating ferredoxin subunit